MLSATITIGLLLLAACLAIPTLVLMVMAQIAIENYYASMSPSVIRNFTAMTFTLGWSYFISALSIVLGLLLAFVLWRRARNLPIHNKIVSKLSLIAVAGIALLMAAFWAIPVGIYFGTGGPVSLGADCTINADKAWFEKRRIAVNYQYAIDGCNYTKGWLVTLPATMAAWLAASLSALIWNRSASKPAYGATVACA